MTRALLSDPTEFHNDPGVSEKVIAIARRLCRFELYQSDVACWCSIDKDCHGDSLIKEQAAVANRSGLYVIRSKGSPDSYVEADGYEAALDIWKGQDHWKDPDSIEILTYYVLKFSDMDEEPVDEDLDRELYAIKGTIHASHKPSVTYVRAMDKAGAVEVWNHEIKFNWDSVPESVEKVEGVLL